MPECCQTYRMLLLGQKSFHILIWEKWQIFDLCWQTYENIPKNREHTHYVQKGPNKMQKCIPRFRHVPLSLYREVPLPRAVGILMENISRGHMLKTNQSLWVSKKTR